MKHLFILLTFILFIIGGASGQQVPRDKVIVEIGTGTWCQYCPGAAMGADDLIENGEPVAVIEYHNGDNYANTYSNYRNSFYNITGFPTAYFDGKLPFVGGSHDVSMYSNYLPRVNQREAIPSSFTIDISGTHTCLTNFTANITVQKVASYSGTNLRLHAVVTESNIQEFWQGQDHLNFVCRKMVPNQNGTVLDFSGNDTQNVTLQFTFDEGWVFDNSDFVVFVQDMSTKEILQGTQISMLDFLPEYHFDAKVTGTANIPAENCTGLITPTAKVRNVGADTLTSLNFYYNVNNGDVQSYSWSGNIPYLAYGEIALSGITFDVLDTNEIVIYSGDPNGNPDQCTENDTTHQFVYQAMYTPHTVKLILRTDANPGETTWDLVNSQDSILYQGGPYTTSGQMIQETFDLPDDDCYTFTIHDSGGDGLLTPGFYLLYYGSNTTIVQGTAFGNQQATQFNTNEPLGIHETIAKQQVQVFPNPFKDYTQVVVSLEQASPVIIKLYNLTGTVVYRSDAGMLPAGSYTFRIDATGFAPGMYLYNIIIGNKVNTGKITLNR
jgi:hypothetical protein